MLTLWVSMCWTVLSVRYAGGYSLALDTRLDLPGLSVYLRQSNLRQSNRFYFTSLLLGFPQAFRWCDSSRAVDL